MSTLLSLCVFESKEIKSALRYGIKYSKYDSQFYKYGSYD
jgi:hypothetical protein